MSAVPRSCERWQEVRGRSVSDSVRRSPCCVPRLRQCLIPAEMNVVEVKMVKCVFCGSLNAAGRFVVPGGWICISCITSLEEPLDWNPVGCCA